MKKFFVAGAAALAAIVLIALAAFGAIFKTVTVDNPTTGANANALVVRAAIDATRDGSVQTVRTLVDKCDWNAPSPCSGTSNNQPFTFKTLGSAVDVKDGQ